MKTSVYLKVVVGAFLPCLCAPAAFADYYEHEQGYGDPNGYHHSEYYSNRFDNAGNFNRTSAYRHHQAIANGNAYWHNDHYSRSEENAANVNRFNWDEHNWNEQRSQLRGNWRTHYERLSEQQQRQIDAQMKVQWLQYHNNKWNGPYTWDQYSDPRFLDYIHSRNPSLLTSVRSLFQY